VNVRLLLEGEIGLQRFDAASRSKLSSRIFQLEGLREEQTGVEGEYGEIRSPSLPGACLSSPNPAPWKTSADAGLRTEALPRPTAAWPRLDLPAELVDSVRLEAPGRRTWRQSLACGGLIHVAALGFPTHPQVSKAPIAEPLFRLPFLGITSQDRPKSIANDAPDLSRCRDRGG
jgi:hypothetical protein